MAYSRIKSERSDPQVSIDLVQDTRVIYESEQWLPGHFALSSAVTAVEVQAAINDTRDDRNSIPVKHDFTTIELEQANIDASGNSVTESVIRSWWREILAIMLSIASLLSAVGVLLAYEDQPLSSWEFRYLPNTVVSQLTTICRSALMFSTASCVSQLSWLHIQEKPQALSELQAFDNASRGPAGAISMLAFPTRYRMPALVGSLITIATLLMEPFGQQVLQFPLRDDLVKGNATFPTTQIYAPVPEAVVAAAESLTSDLTVDTQTQAAIVNSIFGVPSANPYTCLTNSSCSWNDTVTLGVCSLCTNVTSATIMSCSSPDQIGYFCNYTTPGGYAFQTSSDNDGETSQYTTRLNTSTQTTSTQTNNSTEAALIGFATVVEGLFDRTPDITECTLSWCAKVYRNITAQGSSFFAQIEEHPLSYKGYWFEQSTNDPVYEMYEASPGFPTSFNATFTLQAANTNSLSTFLNGLLSTGSVMQYTGEQPDDAYTFSIGTAMLSNPSISYMADNIAAGLTNTIRNLTNLTNDYIIQNHGDSTVQVQYIHVRWAWLSLPASIVLLGLLLLLITMTESRRANALIWKCSPLALLFHPLQGWTNGELDHRSKDEMEKCAKSMRGQLLPGDDVGLRIVKS
ncbi:hypothetical protein KCU73_g3111, partial [Aureobasidium melanogenum]